MFENRQPIHCYLNSEHKFFLFYHFLANTWQSKYVLCVHSHLLSHKERHFNSVKAQKIGVPSTRTNSLCIFHSFLSLKVNENTQANETFLRS